MRRVFVSIAFLAATAGLGYGLFAQSASKPTEEAVARTRKTVRMLDDIYKTSVVLITDKYVDSEDDFSAGSAAVALFKAIDKKGWHKVRLLDATGEPYNADNVAGDEFEKAALLEMKKGKEYYDQVIQKENKPFLRVATAIPVVMDKCKMCHPSYENTKPGQAIGYLSYTLPIE
jgi:hypothetical protein